MIKHRSNDQKEIAQNCQHLHTDSNTRSRLYCTQIAPSLRVVFSFIISSASSSALRNLRCIGNRLGQPPGRLADFVSISDSVILLSDRESP
jgi:hypothetical protein